MASSKEPVGDFYVHVLNRGAGLAPNTRPQLVSSTKLLTQEGKPTVIHFYDGGWGGCRPCAAQMERWARKFPGAQFLCVCVDMVGVARQFGQMFDFRAVVNCHVPSREYFPKGYGQLGCSGFIVADREGNFVSRKTKAYLQYDEMAFDHVEELLRSQGVAADGGTEHGKVEEEKKENGDIEPVPSVGVDSMDEEHKRCEEALALLQHTNSVQALEKLLEALLAHFDHEEKLMALHDFGNASNKGDAFSPFKSHCKDHERILEIGFRALGKAQDYKSPSADVEASNCTTDSWHTPPKDGRTKLVDPSIGKEIAKAFATHANFFDALYDGAIPKMAE